MRKHQTTFSEIVKGRCDVAGIKDQKTLAKKTGMSERTITRHLRDGDWSRDQLHELHRFLHFTVEDMEIFLDGKLDGSGAADESVERLVNALIPALERYGRAEAEGR